MQYLSQERLEFSDCVVMSCKSFQSSAPESSTAQSTQAGKEDAVVIRMDVRAAHLAAAQRATQTLSVAMSGLAFEGRLYRLWRFVDRTPTASATGIDRPSAAPGQVAAAIDDYAIPGADGHTNQLLHRWLGEWNTRQFNAIALCTAACQHSWQHLLARLPDALFFIERALELQLARGASDWHRSSILTIT